jgi:hypothetical protein
MKWRDFIILLAIWVAGLIVALAMLFILDLLGLG